MNLKELYQEIILEHGKNPRNLKKIDNFNKDSKGNNPSVSYTHLTLPTIVDV